jgi:hypothetical protein
MNTPIDPAYVEYVEERLKNLEAENKSMSDRLYRIAIGLPQYEKTYCSQCGGEFGPGNHGFSHCSNHYSAIASARGES